MRGRACAPGKRMMSQCRIRAALICAALALCGSAAPAQSLPDFHTLVDAGAVPAPACSCIAAPFVLPSYRPSPWKADAVERQRYVDERKRIGRDMADGLAGNADASFAVAAHLSDQVLFAGPDPEAEDMAVRWLHLAAEQGHSGACYLLGYRYRQGLSVKQSDEAAAYWFHKDAASGNNVGMVALGLLYAAGRGVPQDWKAAVYWWRKAEPRHPLASRFLGDAYVCGLGVQADHSRALAAYKRAEGQGDATSSIQLGHMYANGCAPPDDEAAVKAYQRAADEGYPEAQVALSELFLAGRGAAPSPSWAYHWARLAERAQPNGEWRARAAAAAKAAARFMSAPEIAAAERIIDDMLAARGRM